jgi:excisionase family DNA binding protein
MEDEIYTVQEVAEKLKITRKGVYDLMRDGRLGYVQIGLRQRRITGAALRAFLQSGQRGTAPSGVQSNDTRMPMQAAPLLS